MSAPDVDAAAPDPAELIYLGSVGEWLAIRGHVDRDAFSRAADRRVRVDVPDLSDDEMPSTYGEPSHGWYVIKSEGDEGRLVPCKPTDPGAEPWTIIATGA